MELIINDIKMKVFIKISLLMLLPSFLNAQETFKLRVMSINTKECGRYVSYKAGPFAEFINSYSPDVVALQEVDFNTLRNGKKDWLGELALLTNTIPYFCQSFTYQGGGYGPALLSKTPFYKAKTIVSKITGANEPRATGWIYIELPGGNILRVGSTHLALESSEITIKNIADINKNIFGEDQTHPTLLIGDFNADEGSDPITYACIKWQDIGKGSGKTIPSDAPKKRLDYIMGYPKGKWSHSSYKIIARPDMSDHCFIVADLIFNKE